uniref:sarcosine dehydrogenase, mitochondrial-like n=1 Tax=Styela clava TaxID=7725 RepID=UPI00193A5CEF|nr:sarcosine dehydrogenase, mitochondrial-like [Styela clava]
MRLLNFRRSAFACSALIKPKQLYLARACIRGAQTSTTNWAKSTQEFPTEADVVVIGGGSIGCSTAYHLSKLTKGNIVLLEKDKLTSGTTWHTAGLLWKLWAHDTMIELVDHTRELMTKTLKEETGMETGWVPTGGMFTAANKERLDEYQVMSTLGQVYGIESYVLSPEESLKVHPLLNVDDLYGTLYSPLDGTMDPAGTCTTYTKAAAKYGAKVFEGCEILGLQVEENDMGTRQIKSVTTDLGTIKTSKVVNCTGVWAPYIGKMAGVRVPQVAYKHAYVVTEIIDGIKTCPNVRDHDGSVYLKRQGDTIQIGGYEPNPIPWEKVEKNFAFGLFDLDWDVFGQHIEAACNRIPQILHTGIRTTVCGPESFTPDGHPLMGEAPEVRGFYHGSAFNSGGMLLGGGAGRELAHWVINGRPQLDMFSMDIRRFPTNLVNEKTWLKERSHETYAKHYSIAFHHDQPLGGRNQRADPLHQELLNRGCFYEERHGWERPAYFPGASQDLNFPVKKYDYYGNYGNDKHRNYEYNEKLKEDYCFDFPGEVHRQIARECLTCRTSGAIFNTSYMGKLFLSGPGASDVARHLFSRDVTKRMNKCTYTLMLNRKGGVEADLVVATMKDANGEPVYYMTVGGATTEYCKAHVNKVMQDYNVSCKIEDKTDEMGIISVQGPNSRLLMKSILDSDPKVIDKMKFSTWKNITIAGCPVTLMRISFVGELGFELHCSNKHLLQVYKHLRENADSFGFCDSGYRAMESMSSEIGFHHWPHTIRSDDSVFESGLDHLCDLDDQDSIFVGKNNLLETRESLPKKKLAVFTLNDQVQLSGHEAIWRNGKPVGYIRSAVYAFALGKSIAYGYIARDGSGVNNEYISNAEYAIKRMGVMHTANVHLVGPFDPKFKRMMGKYDEAKQEQLLELLRSKYENGKPVEVQKQEHSFAQKT